MSSFLGNTILRAFGKLILQDAEHPEELSSDSSQDARNENDDAKNTQETSVIKFARFVDGMLVLFEARIDSLDYIAFSHVWGEWTWRSIPGIPYKVKASQEKADFIANDLPALVGDGAFWMDTLTVDQTKETEVLAIVEAIPTIFRMANKTIAVRECDGLYDCCVAAVKGFEDHADFTRKLYAHADEHWEFVCTESYLQRLWTLQECLLSHTIEFVVGQHNLPKTKSVPQHVDDLDFYRHQNDLTTLADSLWVLAYCVSGSEGIPAMTKFLEAYVNGGTIVNPVSPLRTEEESIHTGNFFE
ncbi:hypothetical protein BKA66DRAFT_572642 [Pyrenochaeta sp. MPI-SDFR-AT-0127]|nr:hypothetical protein BKA66DRAFT_572642 [Pyrenochaeta sp. MPI-SDFR-AT-0127]